MLLRIYFKLCFLILLAGLFGCADLQSVFNGDVNTAPVAVKSQKNSVPMVDSSQVEGSSPVIISGTTRLPIVTKKGVYYFVAPNDSLSDIAKKYNESPQDIAQINDLFDSSLSVGRRLFIPNSRTKGQFLSVTHIVKQNKLEKDSKNSKPKFVWPIDNFLLTSPYGWRRGRQHTGIDLGAKPGTEIMASAEGKVIYAKYSKEFAGYGNLVVVKHSNNYFTAYAHTLKMFVSVGDHVSQGQKIASVGSTGHATGPHLHFEVLKKMDLIDPLLVMPPLPKGSEKKK